MKPDVLVELKSLRLHGMAGAWADLIEQGGNAGVDASRWLIEHLRQNPTVRDNLRHSSLATTSMYLHADDARRAKQLAARFAAPKA